MSDAGWIKLWRSANGHPALTRFDEMGVWSTILMQAARQPVTVRYRNKIVSLETGQLAVSVREWAEKGDIGHKRLRAILAQFEAQGMLELDTSQGTPFTLITVLNYRRFQEVRKANGHSLGHSRDTDEAQARTQTGHTEQDLEEGIQESPTSNVESDPVVVSDARTRAREAPPPAAGDGDGKARKVRILAGIYGMTGRRRPGFAAGDVDAWTELVGWPEVNRILNYAFAKGGVVDHYQLIDVAIANSWRKSNAANQAAVAEARGEVADPNVEAYRRSARDFAFRADLEAEYADVPASHS